MYHGTGGSRTPSPNPPAEADHRAWTPRRHAPRSVDSGVAYVDLADSPAMSPSAERDVRFGGAKAVLPGQLEEDSQAVHFR